MFSILSSSFGDPDFTHAYIRIISVVTESLAISDVPLALDVEIEELLDRAQDSLVPHIFLFEIKRDTKISRGLIHDGVIFESWIDALNLVFILNEVLIKIRNVFLVELI